MVKSVQLSTKLKTTPRMATRSRNHGINDTPLVQGAEQNKKALVEAIRKIVKEEFADYEIVMKEMINASIKNTNDRLDNISKEVAD